MSDATTDVAIVGSGVCGLLVAHELVGAGREVTVIERGGRRSHAEQLRTRSHEPEVPTARHNDEPHPDTDPYPFDYVYAVGGSTLHWPGVAPRPLRSDLELHSRHGVGRDWPIAYDELVPYLEEAERAMAVAGPDGPQPPHPYSPVDELVAPLLEPFAPMAQARTSMPVNGRRACYGVAECVLCPSDSRYSALHTLSDDGLEGGDGFTLLDRTIAARVITTGARATAIECVTAAGEHLTVRANAVVLAANGIENAAILLRSGLDGPDTGRWLSDHQHRVVRLELDRPAGHGRGATLTTGISYAYAEGDWRSERASSLVMPLNPGITPAPVLVRELVAGRRGEDARRRVRERFEHTLVLDTLSEELPRPDRRVELSPNRDAFGLPLNRIRFPGDSHYVTAAHRFFDADVERRLAPLGARVVHTFVDAGGGHQLGTCFMGESDGVVDPNQRHHAFENVYVAGGSAFPTYGAFHPTLTIAALGIRLGRHLGGLRT